MTNTGSHSFRRAWVLAAAILAVVSAPRSANGATYYLDVNGTDLGFGNPNGLTIPLSTNLYTTSTAGTAATVIFPANNTLAFGYNLNDFSGMNITNNVDQFATQGIQVNSTNCTVRLIGTSNIYGWGGSWSVAAGSTLVEAMTSTGGKNIAMNFGNPSSVTLTGDGTITFATPFGANGGTGIWTQTNNVTVNMPVAGSTAMTQSGYRLNSGTLNFGNLNAFQSFGTAGSAKTFIINGGYINNTSGSAGTLNLGSTSGATITFGGNFTFVGTSSLAPPANAATLTASSQITVLNNTLSITGPINQSAAAFGLTKAGPGTLVLGGTNTYSGTTTISAGALTLANTAQLKFVIGPNGVNNKINGTGTVNLNGGFVFDLTGAGTANGNQWTIVDVDNLNENFGSTFYVDGFTKSGTTFTYNNYVFNELTGILSVIPEPSTWALVAVSLIPLFLMRRRR